MPDPTPAAVHDPSRLAALHKLKLLDSASEPALDRLSRLAVKLLGTPIALVSLVDEYRQVFKSQVGLGDPWAERGESPLSHSFCKHVVGSGAPLVVNDAASHDLVHENLAVTEMDVAA